MPYERLRHWMNRNTKKQAAKNISFHYDLGNDFYGLWLDETMTYSSALFDKPNMSLEQAQAKFETDKANVELPSPAAGVLHPAQEVDATLAVGDVVATIDEGPTPAQEDMPAEVAQPEPAAVAPAVVQPEPEVAEPEPAPSKGSAAPSMVGSWQGSGGSESMRLVIDSQNGRTISGRVVLTNRETEETRSVSVAGQLDPATGAIALSEIGGSASFSGELRNPTQASGTWRAAPGTTARQWFVVKQ